jgi:hypothetical protein
MSEECVVGVYENLQQAQQAVHILDRGDFPTAQVSLVTKGIQEQPEAVEDLGLQDDSVRDLAVAAGLGSIIGVMAGLVVTVVSGLGAIFLAGPIGGGMVGATAGAFLGGMSGWGVHRERIRHYEKLVKDGKVLVIAHGDPIQLVDAQRMMRETDPRELHVYAKTDSESPEVRH